MSGRRFFTTLLLLGTSAAFAQQPAARPEFDSFEVATIKQTAPDWAQGRFIRMQTAHQLVARNHTLKTLIAAAWDISPKIISGGPSWVTDEHYDILAVTPGDVRPNLDEQLAMLRALITERFQLSFHREKKEMSVY